jgi:hypothetical protein
VLAIGPTPTGFGALLDRVAAQNIEHEPIETYANGVRLVKVPDPMRTRSRRRVARRRASPRSAGPEASS